MHKALQNERDQTESVDKDSKWFEEALFQDVLKTYFPKEVKVIFWVK